MVDELKKKIKRLQTDEYIDTIILLSSVIGTGSFDVLHAPLRFQEVQPPVPR